MTKIKKIKAREILSSGSVPTLEVKVKLSSTREGVASVPFGSSAGSHEAFMLLDKDPNRFMGKGMLKAVGNVNNEIAPKLIGKEPYDQRKIDQIMLELDGTENKSRLGGNAILGVSLAVARAASNEKLIPLYKYIREVFSLDIQDWMLPNPMMVVIEGGVHAHDSTDLQEYMVSPMGGQSAKENVRMGIETYLTLKKLLKSKGFTVNVGNEGAFAPSGLKSNEAPLPLILEAIEKTGYKKGEDIGISLDPAVSEIFENGKYNLEKEGKKLTSDEMVDYFVNWVEKYPEIMVLEDPLDEDDWDAWTKIMQKVGDKVAVMGDDLTVTNPRRLQKAIDMEAINSILIKLNQIGSLTECVDCCMLARKHGMMTVVSHRGGGETNDTSMVDLAVAVGSGFIKVGPSRGERTCKYNRLMEIEDELGEKARPAGKEFRKTI